MRRLLTAFLLVLGTTGLARADMPGKDWMTMDKVVQKLKDQGYTDLMKIEADDGRWEAAAMKDGKKMEIHLDPHTGEITKSEADKD